MEKEIIRFKDVSIGYGKEILVDKLNFSLSENDFIGLVGPNGAGKTTLLKTILGTLKPVSGQITKKNVRFGYVPQRDLIQPILPFTVYDVVMMARYSSVGVFRNPGTKDHKIIEESLNLVGITELKDSLYNRISGGQKQRTLIARALAVKPDLLVLDEPTNGMDTPSHYSLLNLISDLHDKNKFAVILVSHLLTDVANSVRKLMLIDRNFFQFGDAGDLLSEVNLQNAYSSEFTVTKVEGEYLITSKRRI
jgi:ABC-type Mn2+/Zn2+ transport system ATPase subunit